MNEMVLKRPKFQTSELSEKGNPCDISSGGQLCCYLVGERSFLLRGGDKTVEVSGRKRKTTGRSRSHPRDCPLGKEKRKPEGRVGIELMRRLIPVQRNTENRRFSREKGKRMLRTVRTFHVFQNSNTAPKKPI